MNQHESLVPLRGMVSLTPNSHTLVVECDGEELGFCTAYDVEDGWALCYVPADPKAKTYRVGTSLERDPKTGKPKVELRTGTITVRRKETAPDLQDERDGTPAHVETDYLRIKFQQGPVREVGVNGCQLEDVIQVGVDRLRGFQNGPFRCRENALAITHLEEAQNWLLRRTWDRERRGVEGTDQV